MKKAFIVTTYHLPEQINVFLEQLLADEEADVYIHVDHKSKDIISQLKKDKRISVIDFNVEVNWGSDENLKTVLRMFKYVVDTKIEYEYILLCSGQDLIVKKGLDQYLEEHKGKPFLGCYNNLYYDRYNKAQTLYRWPTKFRRNYKSRYNPYRIMRGIWRKLCMAGIPFGKKQIDYDVSNMKFHYFNYAWPALPIDMAQYMVHYLDENPGYLDIFSNAFDPEEMFYGIFFMNSPFADRIEFDKDGWSESLLFQYKQIGYENHPPILTMNDIEEIERSGRYIARKFDYRVDNNINKYYSDIICR